MDAKEFVRVVAVPNWEEHKADLTNFRKMWNAFVSMNTVPEWMAFDQAGYRRGCQQPCQNSSARKLQIGVSNIVALIFTAVVTLPVNPQA
jgi:hypothetical protein